MPAAAPDGAHTRATVDPAEPEADLATSGRALLALRDVTRELAPLEPDALVTIATAATEPFERRHAAGTLLALLGDPRLPTVPEVVDLPGGTFTMGIDPAEVDRVVERWGHLGVVAEWIAKEAPRHTRTVEPFRIGRYPVTNEQFLAYVLDTQPAERPSAWGHGTFPLGAANHPVYTVSPEQADAYCAWLAATTGRPFRLPTEAEWEYAATGGDGREFPWGNQWDPDRANTAEAGPLTTTPVGIYPTGASPFGVFDLAGNVEEYVADDYAPYPGAELIRDDLVDTYGEAYRVARGGSFARHGDLARTTRRHGWYHSAHYAMGFRVAETT